MAQTKRKRRSKHRGTAAGTIEARGRTGRPPSAEEKKRQQKMSAREQRLNTPPTWKAAFGKGAFAAIVMFGFLALTTKGKDKVLAAAVFALIAFALYVPAGYYLELLLFRRRQRKRAGARAGAGRSNGSGK